MDLTEREAQEQKKTNPVTGGIMEMSTENGKMKDSYLAPLLQNKIMPMQNLVDKLKGKSSKVLRLLADVTNIKYAGCRKILPSYLN